MKKITVRLDREVVDRLKALTPAGKTYSDTLRALLRGATLKPASEMMKDDI